VCGRAPGHQCSHRRQGIIGQQTRPHQIPQRGNHVGVVRRSFTINEQVLSGQIGELTEKQRTTRGRPTDWIPTQRAQHTTVDWGER
jgi:hypothetical protein